MGNVIQITDIERGWMEFREKLGRRDLILYSFLLLWSLIMLSLNFAALIINEWHPLKFFGILALFGFFAIASFLALFRRKSMIIDRLNGKVTYRTRLLWRKHYKDADLSEFDCVSIVKKYSLAKGEHRPFYVISLSGAKMDCVLDTKDDYNSALKLAIDVTGFLKFDLADYSTGQCIVRQADMLSTSIHQRADSIKRQIKHIRKPEVLEANYKADEGKLIIDIPRVRMTGHDWLPIFVFYAVSLLCLGLGIYSLIISYPDEFSSILFIINIVILWIVTTATIRISRFLKSAFQKTTVTASREALGVKRRGLFRSKDITIPTEKLEEFEVIERQFSLKTALFNVVPGKSEVMARSDTTIVYFGCGLTIEELQWVRAEICRILLK